MKDSFSLFEGMRNGGEKLNWIKDRIQDLSPEVNLNRSDPYPPRPA
jgi:hypothetical protein